MMYPLTARRALDAWERGQRSDPQGRALALLSSVLPEVSREQLARLPVGQRDALLMRLRERTFGQQVKGFAQCPKCGVRLEFALDLHTYDAGRSLEHRVAPQVFAVDGYEIQFRVPDSVDLAYIAQFPDVETARLVLLGRCVLAARKAGRPVAAHELPETVIESLGKRMEDLDPLSYVSLSIECARCNHQWLSLMDIGTVLWQEVARSAERLLVDVHTLAMTYGWGEAEILAMSEARRKFYLEQIPQPVAQGKERKRP
jgi:hypothetical protein